MNIEFIPTSDFAEKILPKPMPATKFIPEWYSKMNLFLDDRNSYGIGKNNHIAPNTTMKACSPFLDALTIGYVWSLPMDLEVTKQETEENKKDFIFKWRTEGNFISGHSKDQHPTLPSAFNGMDFVMKFNFDFVIKTPKGYSTFFTHPINRHDLPFRTFSGVVDTDSYQGAVQFPFQMLKIKDAHIVLEKNTPVCQFFSFKRDMWNSKNLKFDSIKYQKNQFEFLSKIKRSYKTQFWSPKEYK